MVRFLLVASALALSAPAIAQEATPATEEAGQTAPAAPATDQPAAQPATVAEVVKAEFPSYDADSSGDLSKAEFSKWVMTLKTKAEPSAASDQVALTDWAGKAFASADTDKNATVTEAELTAFLGG